MTALLILCGCLIGVCVFLAVKYKAAQEKAQERIKVNLAIQQENENLDKENAQLRIDQSSLVSRIDAQKQRLDELQRHTQIQTEYAKMEAKRALDQAYEGYSQEIEQEYRSLIDDEMSSYLSVCEDVRRAEAQLEDLKAKQVAYIQEQLRKEKIQNELDFYRMLLTDNDKDDIKTLRTIQQTFHRKEAIDKIIWEVYYKPAYDVLMSHLFSKGQDKVCGIYKITSITTGRVYIGQSVDCRSRWRDHIKAALVNGNKTNLLYSAMSKEGPENFTFEILEEVPRPQLNEREKYYIDFYQTVKFGMNKTAGGS